MLPSAAVVPFPGGQPGALSGRSPAVPDRKAPDTRVRQLAGVGVLSRSDLIPPDRSDVPEERCGSSRKQEQDATICLEVAGEDGLKR